VSFVDSTPLGRIVNRFSKDMGQVDTQLMFNTQFLVSTTFQLLGTLVIIGLNTTYVLVPFVPVVASFFFLQNYYVSTSVQLKRLDAVSRSPVYSHFSESLDGISTIRAFNAEQRMMATNKSRLDKSSQIYLLFMSSNRWLSLRLELLGGLMILFAALNCVLLRHSLTSAAVGVAMAYALQISTQLNSLVRFSTEFENSMSSVERVLEYGRLPTEAPRKAAQPPPQWPQNGAIQIQNVVMSYREGLPAVLKGLTLDIRAGEKIGVVGRTGAGKSSLFQVLFRLVEVSQGSITVDGVDLATLGLDDVRGALSIIPQEPVLFKGTLRFNLDPFDDFSDAEVWDALDKASLKAPLIARHEGLDMAVADNGENFSVGQRQLVCLARALLHKSKVLVLDEATANVDVETDALIQATIRQQFSDRTTLTIAHRLNTIIDSDRVLVMELGRVREFARPIDLLNDSRSEFSAMVRETGPQNAQFLKSAAAGRVDPLAGDDDLVSNARNKLSTQRHQVKMSTGPLARTWEQAGEVVLEGFSDRHAGRWVRELEQSGIAPEYWLAHMVEVLSKINNAAKAAMEEDEFDAVSAAQRCSDLQCQSDFMVDMKHAPLATEFVPARRD